VSWYATKLVGGPYHLVEERSGQTLCGLKVSRVQKAQKDRLYLIEEKPRDAKLCKHCERLAASREPQSD